MLRLQERGLTGYLQSVIFACVIVASSPLMADDAPSGMHKFNATCPAATLLPILDAAYHACNNGYVDGSCDKFIDLYTKLLPVYDCQRPFDATPTENFVVPAIWLAPEGAEEDYIRLLWRMASRERMYVKWFRNAVSKARTLFASKEFRHSLDGAVAEEWDEKCEQIAREISKRPHHGSKTTPLVGK